jgi:hypothetical protein
LSNDVHERTPFQYGIIFQAHAVDQEEADAIKWKLITHLTLDWGFRDARGGASPGIDPDTCECDGPEDCNRREGCLFD